MRLPWQPDWSRVNAELAATEPPRASAPPPPAPAPQEARGLNEILMEMPAPASAASPLEGRGLQWQQPPRRGISAMLVALYSSPPLVSCVELIAKCESIVPWYVGTLEEQDRQHPAIALRRDMNPKLRGVQGRKSWVRHLVTTGEAIGFMLPSKRPGRLWELYPVPPHWATQDGSDYRIRLAGEEFVFPAERVIHQKIADPLDLYGRGRGPGYALADEVEAYEYTSKHVKTYFYNSACPEAILSSPKTGGPALKQAKKDFDEKHRGFQNHWSMAWLNIPVELHELTRSLGADRVEEMRKTWFDIFRFVYHIPPEIIGNSEDSNRATVKESQQFMGVYVTDPLEFELLEFWQLDVCNRFFDGAELQYVSPIPKVFDRRDEIMSRHPYSFRVNEIRQEAGFAPVKDGDQYPVPSSIAMLEAQRTLRELRADEPILRLVEEAAAE